MADDVAENVLHAMVELGHQQALALLVALSVGDVEDRAHHAQPGPLSSGDGLAAIQKPAHLAVRPDDLELELAATVFRRIAVDVLAHNVAVVGMDHRRARYPASAARRRRCPTMRRRYGRPVHLAGGRIVVVGAEPGGLARKAEAARRSRAAARSMPRAPRCVRERGARARRSVCSSWRVLRHSSAKILTLARRISGTTGTGT